jgi:predicted transcriptional regulator
MSVTNAPQLDKRDIHDVLQNDRRRLAIECLRANDGAMDLRDLSEVVAAEETGEDPAPRDKRRSVYVSLHQTHLPKMDDLGIVAYDTDSKAVTLEDRVRDVVVHMEVVPKYGLSWAEFYLTLGVLGLVTVLASLVGTPVLRDVGPGVFAVVFLAALTTSAAYHVSTHEEWLLDRLRS